MEALVVINATQETIHNDDVSETVLFYFKFWFGLVATNCLTALSFLTNIVNMVLFVKQGLKERVNFTLFCLSICDLMGAVFVTSMTRALSGDVWIAGIVVDWSSYLYVVAWGRNMFVDLSTVLTVFISIERCTCVVTPFTFNTSFIARKSKLIVFTIVSLVVVLYLPNLATIRFESIHNETNNVSIFFLEYTEIYVSFQKFNDFLFGFLVAFGCEICIFVCAVLMYKGLKKSSEVRRSTMSAKELAERGAYSPRLSKKERRVVKMILVLATFYMVTTMPQLFLSWLRVLLTDMQDNLTLSLFMCYTVAYSSALYGGFSAFIYYNFSSSYRVALSRVFRIYIRRTELTKI
ncbi:P2Y purinoceptor 2 [Biomphalaria pfeifferi]|uniref:P2Y purinoceptor 2 n=1 Tax=Biomphalaria pfeifferi TaxID=112525 RepID=A0AAD8B8V9_BIOPF|nr:P2Y purinoceptor 2 [Biomphalaria pfeifferi]